MDLITETWADGRNGLTELSQDDDGRIVDLLMGRRVTKVADDQLLLDDGTLLRVLPNQGGCSCSSGDYELTELNGVDNVITKVEVAREPDPDCTDPGYSFAGTYRVFVYAENQRINLLAVKGDDGNPYYGTGYTILVRRPS